MTSSRGTATSAFGVSKRESHDASAFYERFRSPAVSTERADGGPERLGERLDTVWAADARHVADLPDGSVAFVVTSPPYFAGKEYETALGEGHVPATYLDYLAMLGDVFAECVRVLEPGGRMAVNVANLGRRPYRSLSADVIGILQDDLGLLLRGEVIWQKQRGASGNCAWGSYRSPANPVLRDTTERLIVASKGRFDRTRSGAATATADEFLEATLDVWEIPAESATRVGHPAPFPLPLVERCLHLFTFAGDVVYDPFMGSGTTGVAAIRTGRHFVGVDADPGYVAAASERITLAEPVPAAGDGESLKARALALLERMGAVSVSSDARVAPGVTVSAVGATRSGRPLYVELAGGATTNRPGLTRLDVVWRVIAKAAIVRQVEPEAIVVVFTTHTGRGGPLTTMVGPGRAIDAVVTVGDEASEAMLAALVDG